MNAYMRIGFWGLGSIAKRHIKNLVSVLDARNVTYSIDVYRHSTRIIEDKDISALVSNAYLESELESNGTEYDIFFITNPTSMHFDAIKRCVPYTRHMFIEKPVFDDCYVELSDLELDDNSVYYVACPLRYTAVLQYIKNNLELKDVYAVRAISSSYLPEWRPGVDYRNTYSAHKNLGGGVAIDLIHEWDYLSSFFGIPNKVVYAGGTFSDLEIDSDDLATYIGVYADKIIEVHLDYFGRKTVRECMLFTKYDTIVADLTNSQIRYLESRKLIDLKEDRNQFQKRELEHFLDIVEGKIANDSTIEHAINVLKIAMNKL